MREIIGFNRTDNTADVKKAAKDELKVNPQRAVNVSAGVPYEPDSLWASTPEAPEKIPPYRVVLQAVHKDATDAAAREADTHLHLSTIAAAAGSGSRIALVEATTAGVGPLAFGPRDRSRGCAV